jgi:two-component system, response regulator YesN
MRTSSYLIKLVLLTLMVGTFPVLTLGWYSYHYSSQSVLEQVEESNAQVLHQSQLRVEQTLKMIDYSTSQALSVPAVANSFGVQLGTHNRETVKELYNILTSIQTYELGIRDVYLLSLEQGWLITNTGLNEYNQPGLKEMLSGYSGIAQGSVWISGISARMQGQDGLVDLKNAVISIKKWPINSTNPRGLISVVLSAQQLNQLINTDRLAGSIFILDADNRIIADTDNSKVGRIVSDVAYVQGIQATGKDEGVVKGADSGEKVSVSYRKSAYNGWTYVSVVPTKAITRQASAIGLTSILVSVGVLAATVFAALIGSRKMYSPVRKISRTLLDGKDRQGEKKDELMAISDRIEGILTDQSKLRFELAGQQHQLVELLVRKLMLGEAKGHEIPERLRYYGYGHAGQWDVMRVLLFQIDRLESNRFTEKDRDLLLFAVGNIAAELVPLDERLPPIVIQESVVIVAGSRAQSEEGFKSSVFDLATKVQVSIKGYLQLQTSIGISRPLRQWAEAARGYEEGENALKYRARLGEEAILFIEDVQPDKSKEVIYPKELGEEILEAIKSLDVDRAQAALFSLMEALSQGEYDHNDYQLSLIRLLMDLTRLLQDAGISLHLLHIGENSLFEELLKLHTAREIEAWFGEKIIAPGITLLEERRQAQFTSISQEVKRLIEEAFDTDLTLEKCSARINYHPQYISRVFRQETGINFADYLAQYRLEIAKRWLKETDLTITDIAEKLKYNNPANFIRYFRKMEAMTPGQYRDQNRGV